MNSPGNSREMALQRLNIRDYSSHELRRYLEQHDISPEIARSTVEKLMEEQLVDDRRYARAVTRAEVARHKGAAYIRQKLMQKGIELELADVRALVADTSDRSELETARQLVERRYPRIAEDTTQLRKAYLALRKRGFASEVVRQVMDGRIPPEAENWEETE